MQLSVQVTISAEATKMARMEKGARDAAPASEFAFPGRRAEPLENAAHVRNAVARFNQVEGVTEADRDEAWKRIQSAAKRFGVELHESGWRELKPIREK